MTEGTNAGITPNNIFCQSCCVVYSCWNSLVIEKKNVPAEKSNAHYKSMFQRKELLCKILTRSANFLARESARDLSESSLT